MEHLFIPYNLAKLAKQKGFEEPCFAYYEDWGDKICNLGVFDNQSNNSDEALAPLYQQIIDWCRTNGIKICESHRHGWSAYKMKGHTGHSRYEYLICRVNLIEAITTGLNALPSKTILGMGNRKINSSLYDEDTNIKSFVKLAKKVYSPDKKFIKLMNDTLEAIDNIDKKNLWKDVEPQWRVEMMKIKQSIINAKHKLLENEKQEKEEK